ncbi:MAG: coenzyme F420-0:L-glutamate ligase [Candidatus Heimdallarchaeota archaeon]
MKYTLLAIQTRLIKPLDNIIDVLMTSLGKQNITIENGDILVIASKVISTVENRFYRLTEVTVSQKALWYAERTGLPPEFVELVLAESEKIYGWVHGALLTLHNGILQANAGVDASNAPPGFAVLHPADPNGTADHIRKEILKRFGVRVGVIISDSHTRPLRMGTTSFALAASGLQDVVVDERGKHDLFGREMRVTRRAVADSLATAAFVLMGETAERIPMVIIRNAPVSISERTASACESDMKIDQKQCMFSGILIN